MKVLFMADVPPDASSGAAGTEWQTIAALRAAGLDVDALWAPDLGRRIPHGNLHYLLELPRTYRHGMRQAFAMKRYDVVHANQPHGFLAARELKRLYPDSVFVHRSHGLEPHVAEVMNQLHRGEPQGQVRQIARGIVRQLLARHDRAIALEADGHIVSSLADAEFLRKRLGVPSSRIAVIPQSSPDRFRELPAPPMTLDRLRRILYVGQFARVKGPDVLGGAISRIAARRRDVEVTWICSERDHASARDLLDEGARKRVRFLSWMNQEELLSIYDRHGIFLFPSYFEGFGKAFLEAMTRGLCVVATRVGGARDVITHGSDGLLVEPGDAEALAKAVLQLLSNPSEASEVSSRAAATGRQYSWARVGRETIQFYKHILSAVRP